MPEIAYKKVVRGYSEPGLVRGAEAFAHRRATGSPLPFVHQRLLGGQETEGEQQGPGP